MDTMQLENLDPHERESYLVPNQGQSSNSRGSYLDIYTGEQNLAFAPHSNPPELGKQKAREG